MAVAGAGAGAIYLVDEERGDLVLAQGLGLPEEAVGHRLAPGEGLLGLAVQQGRSVVSHDVPADSRARARRPDWDADPPVRAFLGRPLRTGSVLIGALELTSPSKDVFGPEVRGRVAILADAAALLVEQTRLSAAPPPAALAGQALSGDPLGIAVVDRRLYVTSANAALCRLTGLELEAVVGRPVIAVLPALGRPRGRDALEAALHGTPGHLGSVTSKGPAGEDLVLSLSVLPVGTGAGAQGVMVLALDVSERTRLEAELRQRHAQAVDARDRLRSVVEVVSHELRTPLTSVLGYAQLLRDRPEAAEDQRRRWAEYVVDKSRMMARLVGEVTDLARLGSDRFTLRRQATDLAGLVRRVADEVAATLPQHQVVVTVVDGLQPAEVDAERMEQVVVNLLTNAGKFWPGGGEIEVAVEQDEAATQIEVMDRGPGVPAEERERIFEPFYRSETGANAGAGGTGLGLAISRGIVEGHGGTLTVAQRQGGGAVFTLRLPRRPSGAG